MEQGPRTILIPVDTSEHSRRAIQWYTDNIAKRDTDTVILFSVVEPSFKSTKPDKTSDCAREITENLTDTNNKTSRNGEELRKSLEEKGFTVTFESRIGNKPGEVIVQFAADKNVSVIIIGNRGLGAIKRTFLGSVSEYVLHHSSCPVSIVPPPMKA